MTTRKAIPIILAAVCAFAASSAWYSSVLFGRQSFASSGLAATTRPVGLKIAAELSRNLLLAFVISWLLGHHKPIALRDAIGLVIILWLGFPFTLLSGSALWQNVPLALGLIHGGDWLLKILLMTLTLWLIDRNSEMRVHLTRIRAARELKSDAVAERAL